MVGRIERDRCLLDLRCVPAEHDDELAAAVEGLPPVHVIATAGHVDHGKSTLVRALTGMEPDRFAEERRRGMTIDLGYAWTLLPSGEPVSFVDVPGHQRFIDNMLAGVGPAPAVLLVVAADEGWRRQSVEHLAAVDALRACGTACSPSPAAIWPTRARPSRRHWTGSPPPRWATSIRWWCRGRLGPAYPTWRPR